MKGIIPTGGRGTRMRPITFTANKHFIPVGGKPLIYYPVENTVGAGIREIAITYNPGGLELAKHYLGDGSKWSAKFTYILQPEPIGLANIIEVCEEYLNGSSFVFHLGDNIFTAGISKLVNYFETNKPDGLLALVHHKENFRLGVPYYDKSGRLVKYIEKPKNPPHDLGIPGLYFSNSHFFKCFKGKDKIKPSTRGEYEIPAPYQWLLDRKYRVETMEIDGVWMDPGKFDDWLEANRYLLDSMVKTNILGKVDKESKIEGRVIIGKNTKIINSVIRGPVIIDDNVEIKDGFVGPFTHISHGVKLEKTHIENSVIMEGVEIRNMSKPIDGSIMGPGSKITNGGSPHRPIELFIGEMANIKL